MVPADLGLLPSLVRPTPSEVETAITVVQRQVFRRIQLPLDKLLHVQKVTKASFSEISMSLLSGALRAYQQVRIVVYFKKELECGLRLKRNILQFFVVKQSQLR